MIGFIGTGNMATAMINALVSSKTLKGDEIGVYDIDKSKAASLAEKLNLTLFADAETLVKNCAQIVLAVKPNVLPSVLLELKNSIFSSDVLVISIAAGKSLDFLSQRLFDSVRLVRVMPNINATVGEAVSAYCENENATAEDVAFVETMCNSFGKAVKLDEKMFPLFGVIGGSSPAFAYIFIDAMARAAVKNGMPKARALEICAQSVLGSAKMILESQQHPMELVDRVCSPGGTTIEGVLSLQKDGFEAAVAAAVNAAFEKDKRL